jgi:hypothetical protein
MLRFSTIRSLVDGFGFRALTRGASQFSIRVRCGAESWHGNPSSVCFLGEEYVRRQAVEHPTGMRTLSEIGFRRWWANLPATLITTPDRVSVRHLATYSMVASSAQRESIRSLSLFQYCRTAHPDRRDAPTASERRPSCPRQRHHPKARLVPHER